MSKDGKHDQIDSSFWRAVISLIESLSDSIGQKLEAPVRAYMAGGSAFHFHTGARVSKKADIAFSHRIIIPQGMVEFYYHAEDHTERSVAFDNNALGLMHPDCEKDAISVGRLGKDQNIDLYVISAVDLAVSKLSRFSERDESDIKILAGLKLFTREELNTRANEAMNYYVGDLSNTRFALEVILDYMQTLETGNNKGRKP